MGPWISYVEAASRVGCTRHNIEDAVKAGRIETRNPTRTRGGRASLSAASVAQFAAIWQAEQAEAAAGRAAREARAAAARTRRDPPDDDVWLDVATTALILGVGRSYVRQLAAAGRIPAQRPGDRWWFRRIDVEQLDAARAFMRIQAASRSRRSSHTKTDRHGG